jgi:hypothetical protein
MIGAAIYILKPPKDRRDILLDQNLDWRRPGEPVVAEPVPRFDHSRRAPLIVLASFKAGAITHIADGRKGASAGTGLVRLNLTALRELTKPIRFADLTKQSPPRLQKHVRSVLDHGGKLPPKSSASVADVLLSLDPALADRLARMSARRTGWLRELTLAKRVNLAVQKETLAAALEIARIGTDDLLAWEPREGETRLFLEGLPHAYVREDAMLLTDFTTVPGFDAIKSYPFAAREFQNTQYPRIRLKVIMANRLPLEEQTGADLIYYNETYNSFVMVQYKAMNRGVEGEEFRWQPDDQLADEISRMEKLLEELRELPADSTPSSFRLNHNPFFLKVCSRTVFNPDDKGLFNGMYLPLDLWKRLSEDNATKGPRGGRVLTYQNAGRWLTNSDFVSLVASAWVGTPVPQSDFLRRVIESVIETGKTVTLAVKRVLPSDDSHVGHVSSENPPDLDTFLEDELSSPEDIETVAKTLSDLFGDKK